MKSFILETIQKSITDAIMNTGVAGSEGAKRAKKLEGLRGRADLLSDLLYGSGSRGENKEEEQRFRFVGGSDSQIQKADHL